MIFDHITFASPWLLGFLAALPLLWWLLRLTPPSPRKVVFPALALLRGLAVTEQTPARTPWWILLLRLVIAALLIIGFARPLMNPQTIVAGQGAMPIAIDNDWAAARDWDARQKIVDGLIHQAKRENREVILLPTAPLANGDPLNVIGPIAADGAAAEARRIVPQPWPSDWQQANAVLQKIDHTTIADAVWVSSGLGNVDAKIFYATLKAIDAHPRVLGTAAPIYMLMPPQNEEGQLALPVMRAVTDDAATLTIDAVTREGNVLARMPASFAPGAPHISVPLKLPADIRNAVARFEVEGRRSAAVALLDSGWQYRPVGLVGDKAELDQHSLLNGLFYIDRALKPYADIHVDHLDALLKQNMAVIIIDDTAEVSDADITPLTEWIKQGGVLVRFAGQSLALAQNPREADILPVTLRAGDRSFGGTLSWETPHKLRDFPSTSPFFGLALPPDVTVTRQILAEPAPDLVQKTWADLEDGTPLVTAKNIGQGLSVLFHVPARSDWSNLPLSGLFVEMLRRTVELSHGLPQGGANLSILPPLRMLDGFGEPQQPANAVQPIIVGDFSQVKIGPQHPPGLYGTDAFNRAYNLGTAVGQPEALNGVSTEIYQAEGSEEDLQPYLLAAAFILLLGDFLISLHMRGLFARSRNVPAALGLLILIFTLHPAQALDDKTAIELTSKTYLAYVHTNRETDHIAETGLTGLARILQRRTSVDNTGITGVDPDTDDLTFFPLIYWPIVPGEAPLSPQGVAHVNNYLHHGGMILFDAMNGEDASPVMMQKILAGVDLPPLVRIPDNHVLKRSFYLLNEFPGRFATNDFWLEPEDASAYDGVATVLYGNNGWAAAWAVDNNGQPMFPCTPGGELQREHAFRFGINLVMYALTGNYKSDQMHAQALLQRFGK